MRSLRTWGLAAGALLLAAGLTSPVSAAQSARSAPAPVQKSTQAQGGCARGLIGCAEVWDSEAVFGEGHYVGHDEPSNLFYDSHAGSGNNYQTLMRLPKESQKPPTQDGKGGTWNFQLHPAFWFGMAMCDNQSAPEFTHTACAPDTDANIFNDANPAADHYIGKHPGTAFMEFQFYPPGWGAPEFNNTSCDATRWCAALTIDSLSLNQNNGVANNTACVNNPNIGIEPVNFALLTRDGRSQAPADPTKFGSAQQLNPDPKHALFMHGGDTLALSLHDTPAGFRVSVDDLTSGTRGSMTASTANGFAQVNYQPTGTTCTSSPYAFHPMYSSTSEATRVPWAAHSYNTAFSDEIGHWEYCNTVDTKTGNCTSAGANDPKGLDSDDTSCTSAQQSLLIKVSGCTDGAGDNDFDGTPYINDWPGTNSPAHDAKFSPRPVIFTSPRFNGGRAYARSAFETDMPRIEQPDFSQPGVPPCNNLTGANCVNPPPGAAFYPIFTTRNVTRNLCVWQLGGSRIPGTTNTFGGNSVTEYGPQLKLLYPSSANGQPAATFRINDFRQVLPSNPC